jgi:hypothetical protein
LIKSSGEADVDGWRLPAPELEKKVAGLIGQRFNDMAFVGKLIPGRSAAKIDADRSALQALNANQDIKPILALVERIGVRQGELTIKLDATALATTFKIDADRINAAALILNAPFQLRKRGVETKLVFAESTGTKDDALIRNIAKAHHWFDQIKSGKTFAEIAANEQTSKRRIQQMIGLAFLAPDIVRDVLAGNQPIGFTSDWCLRHDVPGDWSKQRLLLSTL